MKILRLIILFLICGMTLQASTLKKKVSDSSKVVVHTVLFKFSEQITQEQVGQLMNNIGKLKNIIPGIIDIAFGRNFSERSKGFTYVVTIKFINTEALKKFYVHPAHQELIKNFIKPIAVDIIVVDYEDVAN